MLYIINYLGQWSVTIDTNIDKSGALARKKNPVTKRIKTLHLVQKFLRLYENISEGVLISKLTRKRNSKWPPMETIINP